MLYTLLLLSEVLFSTTGVRLFCGVMSGIFLATFPVYIHTYPNLCWHLDTTAVQVPLQNPALPVSLPPLKRQLIHLNPLNMLSMEKEECETTEYK